MLPDKMNWDEIGCLYEKAKVCLQNPEKIKKWKEKPKDGWFYLWNAYYYASAADRENMDHKTYARILAMIAHELHFKIDDNDRYRKFLSPAVREYEKAIACGQEVNRKEYLDIKEECDFLDFQALHEEDTEENWKEIVSLIENGELMDEKSFQFHDSEAVYFQHTKTEAILKLAYDDFLAVFAFQDVCSIEIDTDPLVDRVLDFHCYRDRRTGNLDFEAGGYHIICKGIVLQRIEEK